MHKKTPLRIALLSLFILSSSILAAQQYYAHQMNHNFFVSLGVGANFFYGDLDEDEANLSFSERVAPNIDLAFGWQFLPSWAVRLQYNGPRNMGHVQINGENVHRSLNYHVINLEVMVDLMSIFNYNPPKLYHVILFTGVGRGYVLSNGYTTKGFFVPFGMINRFRLQDQLFVNAELRWGLGPRLSSDINNEYIYTDIPQAITIGISYYF